MFISGGMDKEDVVPFYNRISLSHKKEQSNVICSTWTDLEIVMLSEVRQTEKDKYHMISLICGV